MVPLSVSLCLLLGSCGATSPAPAAVSAATRPALPLRPSGHATSAFWSTWADGKAELSGYHATVPRYRALHDAELVLVYVTEPLDRETLIKDDAAPAPRRLPVMKLNISLKFQTGIYPYSVLTSVFAPVDGYFDERFAPAKLTMTAQEWCGHVFEGMWVGPSAYAREGISYFADEGEVRETVSTAPGALYEDALLIQLRELDGPFLGGAAEWHGEVIPSLWRTRRTHAPARPLRATITRAAGTFTLRFDESGFTRTFEVEQAGAHRILAWRTSDGEDVRIMRTARLAYWRMHDPGDEAHREEIGEDAHPLPPATPPEGTTEIGL